MNTPIEYQDEHANPLFSHLPTGFFAYDEREEQIVLADGTAQEVLGIKARIGGGFAPRDAEHFRRFLRRLDMAAKAPERHLLEVIDARGDHRSLVVSGKRLRCGETELWITFFVDITEAKSELVHYRGFFDNAVEGIFQSTPDGRFLSVNMALAEILGYDSPEDMVDSLQDLKTQLYVDPRDRDHLLQALANSGRVTGLETRFRRKDGGIKWIAQAAREVRDPNGKVLFIEGLNIDITARKKAEEAYNDILERYRSIFSSSIDGVVLTDDRGLVLTVNPEAGRVFSLPSEEVVGKNMVDLADPADPVFRQAFEQLSRGGSFRGEIQGIRGGEGRFPMEVSASSYRNKSGAPHYVWVVRDVTTRKLAEQSLRESEEKFRRTFDQSPIGASMLSLDYRFLRINDAFSRITGYTEDELRGKNVFSITHPEDVPEGRQKLDRLARGLVDRYAVDKRYVHKDGHEVWVHASIGAVRDAKGAPIYYLPMVQDITERKRSEREMQSLLRENEKLRLNLEAVFRSIPDSVVVVDTDMRVIQTNRAVKDVCCVASEEGGPGAGLMLAGACKRACFEVVRKTLRTREPVVEYRVECVGKHPGRVVVVNSMPLIDENTDFAGAVLVIRDITRLAGLERRLGELAEHKGIIGKSKPMRELYSVLDQLGEVDTTVLVTGESGTGKELVAEALHYGGSRAKGPLIKVNCSALSESLLESELFGHVRGAFTGAIRDKVGRFEAAEGGTIFLDEIGDISPRIQLNLLRVLERKEFERVGDSKTRQANVRVIAATNVDLHERIRQGAFREDLYYRLKVMSVQLPPLRERIEDIPLLVEHFISIFQASFGKSISGLSEDVLRIFMDHAWPGNVRELKYALEHACVLCSGGHIELRHLPRDFLAAKRLAAPRGLPEPAATGAAATGAAASAGGQGRGLTRQEITDALEKCGENRAKAARLLGVHRRTLYRNMERLGIA